MKRNAIELESQGYIIDRTCYPWLATRRRYIGPNLVIECSTELESKLLFYLNCRESYLAEIERLL